MSKVVIEAKALSKSYQDGVNHIEVLKNIDLCVKRGDLLAIVGASGSGKSTLLHLLGGLDKPSSGDVCIAEKNINSLNTVALGDLRNKNLGFVYQFHHLLPEFSALENVAMPLLISGISVKQAKERAASMLERVGLAQRLRHKPSQLSGGERQRTAIARAIVTEPACVLADEPTGNLDSKTAHSVFDLLLQLNADLACSLIVVTHDLVLSERMQRTVTLQDGVLSEQ